MNVPHPPCGHPLPQVEREFLSRHKQSSSIPSSLIGEDSSLHVSRLKVQQNKLFYAARQIRGYINTLFFIPYILLSVFYLTSCGFHLRGEVNLAPPLHHLYIKTSDPYGQLTKNLRLYFKQSNIHLASDAKDATTILEILSEQENQQMLSVSGTQQTRQYNLILTVSFQLVDAASGKIIVPTQVVSESRTLTIQTNQILAGSNESLNLYHQMRRVIVFDIINRLASRDITSILTTKSP